MTLTIDLILYLLAFVFLVIRAIGVNTGRFDTQAAAFACLVLSLIV